ncbi:MAG: menaquinone biosynthesis protein [Verrucomicrobium sp.]|nr:menaquinone biosynthesis protein [Verrucomicrobium sp.]
MTPLPRLGSVPYRNVAPLIHGLEPEPRGLVPARLADALRAGEFDAALVPVAELLQRAEDYAVVDGAAVAARGAVYSVILIPEGKKALGEISRVALDPSSRTSVLLARVLLEIGHGRKVDYVLPDAPADARLLIGDPAIAFRAAHPETPVLDLGELWHAWTGLPFVFAAWVVRRGAATPELGRFLRETKEKGLAARDAIARDAFEREYFTRYIRYDLGAEEKAGLLRFAEYLKELGVLSRVPEIHWI